MYISELSGLGVTRVYGVPESSPCTEEWFMIRLHKGGIRV